MNKKDKAKRAREEKENSMVVEQINEYLSDFDWLEFAKRVEKALEDLHKGEAITNTSDSQ